MPSHSKQKTLSEKEFEKMIIMNIEQIDDSWHRNSTLVGV